MDLYLILGLAREATHGDVKRAYKRLARKYHPDINPGDRMAAVQFRQIADAYATLVDPDRRRRYDTTGDVDMGESAGVGFQGFDFSMAGSGADAPTFGDLFADVLRRDVAAPGGSPSRGADLHQTMDLAFEEALEGGEWSVTVTRQDQCRACLGVGVLRTAESPCLHCQGTGIVTSARGHMVFTRPCRHCGGSGAPQTRCMACAGQSVETRTETVRVTLPPGLANGTRVRVPGKGHAGRGGGDHGDLYITVRVAPHRLFRREGDDLHLVVPVAVHEAALGARIEVPALDGVVRLRVPPGTQSGQRFRLRERGAPSAQTGRRGDLVVEIRLVLPRVLDERSKELLRQFGAINGEDVRHDLHSGAARSVVP